MNYEKHGEGRSPAFMAQTPIIMKRSVNQLLDRFCWIKGDLNFEALRQACLEPEGRSYIGAEPPGDGLQSRVISSIDVAQAVWLRTSHLPLNSGLVAVIGARGSGKTALVEMIAAGATALSGKLSDR